MWSGLFGLIGLPGMPVIPLLIAALVSYCAFWFVGEVFEDSLVGRLISVGVFAFIFYLVANATWDGFASRVIHQTSWVVDRHLGAINTGWFSTLFFLSSLTALLGAIVGAIFGSVEQKQTHVSGRILNHPLIRNKATNISRGNQGLPPESTDDTMKRMRNR